MAGRLIVCDHCGIQFSQSGRGRPRKYCSKECLWIGSARAKGVRPIADVNAERRAAATRICRVCGAGFVKRNGDAVWHHCSKRCAVESQRRAAPVTEARREFAKWARPNRVTGYTSRINTLRLRVNRKRTICVACGAIISQRSSGLRRYCTDECRRSTPEHREALKAHRKKRKAAKRAATVETVRPLKVFERDGWRCHLCGGQTNRAKRGTLHPNAPELDHIVPLSKGGEHSYANTACSHKKCNAAKSDRIIGQPSLLVTK